jgi:transposase
MAMGTRKDRERQEDLWVAYTDMAVGPGHPFYVRLNEVLDGEGFDAFVEKLCARYYAEKLGRPGLTPGIYFRSLMIGYFEGIESERGIAWRLKDSLSLRRFLGIALDEDTPDHSTISRTRRLIDLETHKQVFSWVLGLLADRALLAGKRIGIDATTLEASAAMRSIVRRDTGESYEEFLTGLAKASGIETPTREDLARLDRKRKKRTSNKEWKSSTDQDARVAKMKDGSTHLAHKAEHAVDLDSGAVVAVTLQAADLGDTTTMQETLADAGLAVADLVDREAELYPDEEPTVNVDGIEELVADKGYHSGEALEQVKELEVRTYIPEKKQAGKRHWKGKQGQQQAVYQNRQRVRGEYGKKLLRRRGEFVERTFAHCYETGGMRRCTLHGRKNILKRMLIHVGAFNISLVLRKMLGAGKPRELKNRMAELVAGVLECLINLYRSESAPNSNHRAVHTYLDPTQFITVRWKTGWEMANYATGSLRLIFRDHESPPTLALSGTPFTVSASGATLNAPGCSQVADQVKPHVAKYGTILTRALQEAFETFGAKRCGLGTRRTVQELIWSDTCERENFTPAPQAL